MKQNILIVDDEPDIRDVISVILNDEGYNTNCVSNAQEAQAKINIEIPSLIILDIWMRDSTMDGLSLLNWIKDSNPEIPVLMISGHGTVEIAVNAIKAGAYDFIEKPFKSEKLLFMVSRALENSELKKENEEYKGLSAGPGGITFLYGQAEDYTIANHSFFPKEGDMYIFPALLQHWVAPFKSDCLRISVSGNFHDQVPLNNVVNFAPQYIKDKKKK